MWRHAIRIPDDAIAHKVTLVKDFIATNFGEFISKNGRPPNATNHVSLDHHAYKELESMPERFRLKPKNSDELKKSWQLIESAVQYQKVRTMYSKKPEEQRNLP